MFTIPTPYFLFSSFVFQSLEIMLYCETRQTKPRIGFDNDSHDQSSTFSFETVTFNVGIVKQC